MQEKTFTKPKIASYAKFRLFKMKDGIPYVEYRLRENMRMKNFIANFPPIHTTGDPINISQEEFETAIQRPNIPRN